MKFELPKFQLIKHGIYTTPPRLILGVSQTRSEALIVTVAAAIRVA
jgi:hypothetical protein